MVNSFFFVVIFYQNMPGWLFYQLSFLIKYFYQNKMKSTLKITIFLCLLYFTMQAGFQCNVNNCQFCSYPNVCGLCQSGSILTLDPPSGSFICTPITCPSNCQLCYKNNVCQVCNSNFILTISGGCTSGQPSNITLPQNCNFGTGPQACQNCSFGYSLQAGFCYPIISLTYNDPNCKIKMTPEICQICTNSSYIVNLVGKCVLNTLNQQNCNILNCLYCTDSNSTCAICSPGYQLSQSNTCTQTTCNMPGCIACAGSGQCSACMIGYKLLSNKTCQLAGYGCNINGCQFCSSAQSCGQCNPGYQSTPYQVGSNTYYLCRPLVCPYNVTNCNGCTQIYNSLFNYNQILCASSKCSSGYVNVNGYCVANLQQYIGSSCTVTNCTTCSYPQFCSVCSPGFSVTSVGSCQPTVCTVPNCQTCSLNNICQMCNSGFMLTIGNIPLLQAANSNLQQWATYLLQNQCTPSTISCNIANCAYCSTNNVCAACAQGYDFPTASSNSCQAFCTISNCMACVQSNQNLCQTCNTGYQIQANGTSCQPITFSCGSGCSNQTANCVYNWVTNQGECQQCMSGMTLYKTQCYSQTCNINGCSVCANWLNPVVCLQCNQGLFLAYGYCITPNCNSNVANCANCIDGGRCVACKQNYLLQNNSGTVTCIQASSISNCLVDNCLACQSNNNMVCQTCALPYIVQNGMCVCNFQNCLDCKTSALACDSCPQPLFATLQVAGCTPEPSLKNTCNVPNCQVCFGSGLCSVCSIGFQVSAISPTNFTCVQNSCGSISNCQLCDSFAYECFLCNTGFMVDNFLEGGACRPINLNYTCNISGCAVCSSTNNSQCAKCLETYTMTTPTICTPNGCTIANCYLCLQNNFCTVCDTGYYLANDLSCQPFYSNISNCAGKIAYCDICVTNLVNSNSQPYCIRCQDGFEYDSVNNVCTAQTNSIPNCKIQVMGAFGFSSLPYCFVCAQNYYPNSWGLCSQYTPNTSFTGCNVYNCLYCAQDNATCSFCFVPWGISTTGQCQTNASGICAPNCNTCANSSLCYSCVTGYSLFNSGCVQCNVNFCQTCQTSNICSTCISSAYTLLNNNCLACNITNCQSCTGVNVCGNCVNGTVLSSVGSTCVMCNLGSLTGCISCSSDNTCGVCQTQFQLVNGACITCNVQNCLSCSSSNTCATCAATYSLSGGNCIQCLFPCTTCSASNVCSTCSTPFYFATPFGNPPACIANTIPNCQSYTAGNTSSCSACITGYSLANNVCTFNCPLNCIACSNSTTCTACSLGFTLSGTSCTQCQVSGCQTCNNPTTCTACFGSFYLLNNQCKSCPGFCSSCLNSTVCSTLVTTSQNVLVTVSPGQTALALCQQNCMTCSSANPSVCLQCADGFYIANSVCQQCSSSCQTCASGNPQQCITCFPNTFLSGTSCAVCNSNCLTCLGASDLGKCTSCSPGSFLMNQTCVSGCPQNCLICSNTTVCTQCVSGYTLFTQGSSLICVTCISSCRTCVTGSPESCLSCGTGFYLSGTSCVQCAINCQNCLATGCTSCVSGYFLNSAQTCSQNCIFPCGTCLSSNPTKCTSCIAGYSYNSLSNTCGQQLTCNGGCVACPFGYALSNGKCIPCSASNCQTCAVTATNQCTSCITGFFLSPSTNQCQTCPSSCATCLTGAGCMTCAIGFTTLQNAVQSPSGFQCVACSSPCATCINSPNYCTSCVSGFQFQGWKCSQSFNFGFALTLLTNLTTFNTNYFAFIQALTKAVSNSNVNAITILSITNGSVIINGQVAPPASSGSKTANQQFSSLDATLSQNNNIAGMQIGGSTIVVNGGSVDFSDVNLALILGICIPVGVLLITGIALYIYCKKKRSSEVIEQKIKEDSGFTVRQSFELSANYKEQSSRPFEQNTAIN